MIHESSHGEAWRSVNSLAVAFVSRYRTRPFAVSGIALREVDGPNDIDPGDDVVLFYGAGMAHELRKYSVQARGALPPAVMLAPALDWGDVRLALDYGAVGYLLENRYAFLLGDALLCASTGGSILDPAIAAEQIRSAARVRTDGRARVVHLTEDTQPPGSGGSAPLELLSPREREVMTLLAEGHAVREVADAMCLAEKTVRHHLSRIYGKLGVRGQSEAILRWFGLLEARRPDNVAGPHTADLPAPDGGPCRFI